MFSYLSLICGYSVKQIHQEQFQAIKNETSGQFEHALKTILQCSENPAKHFAKVSFHIFNLFDLVFSVSSGSCENFFLHEVKNGMQTIHALNIMVSLNCLFVVVNFKDV